MANTLEPRQPPYPPDVEAMLARYPQRGYLLTLFQTFAQSPRFLAKGVPNLLDQESPLPLKEREIVILRVTARLDCEYEWGVHVAAFARAAELTDAQVAATRLGDAASPCWTPREALLVAVVDGLNDDGTLDPATAAAFAEAFTVAQQLEILALAGAYRTISYVANLARLPPEPFGARFPAAA